MRAAVVLTLCAVVAAADSGPYNRGYGGAPSGYGGYPRSGANYPKAVWYKPWSWKYAFNNNYVGNGHGNSYYEPKEKKVACDPVFDPVYGNIQSITRFGPFPDPGISELRIDSQFVFFNYDITQNSTMPSTFTISPGGWVCGIEQLHKRSGVCQNLQFAGDEVFTGEEYTPAHFSLEVDAACNVQKITLIGSANKTRGDISETCLTPGAITTSTTLPPP